MPHIISDITRNRPLRGSLENWVRLNFDWVETKLNEGLPISVLASCLSGAAEGADAPWVSTPRLQEAYGQARILLARTNLFQPSSAIKMPPRFPISGTDAGNLASPGTTSSSCPEEQDIAREKNMAVRAPANSSLRDAYLEAWRARKALLNQKFTEHQTQTSHIGRGGITAARQHARSRFNLEREALTREREAIRSADRAKRAARIAEINAKKNARLLAKEAKALAAEAKRRSLQEAKEAEKNGKRLNLILNLKPEMAGALNRDEKSRIVVALENCSDALPDRERSAGIWDLSDWAKCMPVRSVLNLFAVSVRLSNVVRNCGFEHHVMQDFVKDSNSFLDLFRKSYGVGKLTSSELQAVLCHFADAADISNISPKGLITAVQIHRLPVISSDAATRRAKGIIARLVSVSNLCRQQPAPSETPSEILPVVTDVPDAVQALSISEVVALMGASKKIEGSVALSKADEFCLRDFIIDPAQLVFDVVSQQRLRTLTHGRQLRPLAHLYLFLSTFARAWAGQLADLPPHEWTGGVDALRRALGPCVHTPDKGISGCGS